MMVRANLARALLLVASAAAVVLHLAPVVHSHALIGKPMSRNLWALVDPTTNEDREYTPSGMNGGTGEFTNPGNKLQFPYSIHAKCGEWLKNIPRKYDNMRPSYKPDTYAPGSVIDFHIITSANHAGRHLFRVCPLDFVAGQEEVQCVNMTRADGKGEVWYYPGPGYTDPFATQYKWPADASAAIANTPTWVVKFKLPTNLPFSGHVVIQWFWATGNTCTPPPCTPKDPSCAFNPGLPPCEGTPEVYFNCMDVIIGGAGAPSTKPYSPSTNTLPATQSPAPVQTPAVPAPVPEVTTPVYEPAPVPTPVPAPIPVVPASVPTPVPVSPKVPKVPKVPTPIPSSQGTPFTPTPAYPTTVTPASVPTPVPASPRAPRYPKVPTSVPSSQGTPFTPTPSYPTTGTPAVVPSPVTATASPSTPTTYTPAPKRKARKHRKKHKARKQPKQNDKKLKLRKQRKARKARKQRKQRKQYRRG